MSHHESTKAALHKYLTKKTTVKKSSKNRKPEKEVEKACMNWFRDQGFSMNVIEASGGRNMYGAITVKSGFVDSAGCTPLGIGSFVEFKAPGRLSTLRDNQREFLLEKINKGCFACVVDSAGSLSRLYQEWYMIYIEDKNQSIELLLNSLPKKRVSNDKLF